MRLFAWIHFLWLKLLSAPQQSQPQTIFHLSVLIIISCSAPLPWKNFWLWLSVAIPPGAGVDLRAELQTSSVPLFAPLWFWTGGARVAKQKNPNSVSSFHPPPPPPAAAVPTYQAHISRLHNTSSPHSIKANYSEKDTVLKRICNSKEYQSPHYNYKGVVICKLIIWSYPSDCSTSAYCACTNQYCIHFLTLNNNYCMCITIRGRFGVGVGVVFNKTQSTR